MLTAIRKDDFEKFSLILTEFQDNLHKLEDSRGKNFFHDLCEYTMNAERVEVYFFKFVKVISAQGKINYIEQVINKLALIDEDRISPLHYAVICKNRVKLFRSLRK